MMRVVNKKRGLSKSSNMLLITMLILITASIIWIVLRGPLRGTASQIQYYESELDIKIEKVQYQGNSLNITVKRNVGKGQFIGTSFLIETAESSEFFVERTILNELEMKTFTFNLIEKQPENIIKIKIAPIFKLDTGEEMVGETKDEYEFSIYKQD